MLKIPDKVKQMLKPETPAENIEVDSGEILPDISAFPKGRALAINEGPEKNRVLTANMTGQVTLTGSLINLHFNRGSLKKISSGGKFLFDKLSSRTRFITSKGTIDYRNESAFSFDDEYEYGLRTLQKPKHKGLADYRVITDFTFNRDKYEAQIMVKISYPQFKNDSIVKEAAILELCFINEQNSGIEIISKDGNGQKTVKPADDIVGRIPGHSFNITVGKQTIVLTSETEGLWIKTGTSKGKRVLFINPGGSYQPAPAEYYSGVEEQFCVTLNLKQD